MDGVLIINKPAGFTSHDVVAKARRILGERSIGHLGTLDPAATGVLPLVVGRFTRLAQYYNEADKRYEGTIRFGWATDTYDAQGEPLGPPRPVNLTIEQVREAAGHFAGRIEQMPPPFSAKKIGGIPAYKLARKKQEVVLEPKAVEIKELEITDWNGTDAGFRAWVSSGTYIRTLAHELGERLGTGAHLASLVRTAVREFTLDESHSLEELEQAGAARIGRQTPEPEPGNPTSDNRYAGKAKEGLQDVVLPDPEATYAGGKPMSIANFLLSGQKILSDMPAVQVSDDFAVRIRQGRDCNLPEFTKARLIRVFHHGHIIAIARRIAGTLFHPQTVL